MDSKDNNTKSIPREIMFRGKSVKTGNWVYGYYAQLHFWETDYHDSGTPRRTGKMWTEHAIFNDCDNRSTSYWKDIHPETLGQFTGFTDCNDVKIYEGDIVKGDSGIGQVVFEQGIFYVDLNLLLVPLWNNRMEIIGRLEIIGNIFDNPELLPYPYGGKTDKTSSENGAAHENPASPVDEEVCGECVHFCFEDSEGRGYCDMFETEVKCSDNCFPVK